MYKRKTEDVYVVEVKEGRGKARYVHSAFGDKTMAESMKSDVLKHHPTWDLRITKRRIKFDE